MPRIGEKKLRAVGVTCGIGSMLVGARQAGFHVVGNIEWRRYYHREDTQGRNTFLENFPGAIFPYSIDDLSDEQMSRMFRPDIALGHPECGNFSNLGGSCKDRDKRMKDPCDIPLFIDIVSRLKPRFFVMDDLPKSFGAYSIHEYKSKLPGYDLFPEWISNHGYGNVQKNRKRMFMIGSLQEESWVFDPGEEDNKLSCKVVIGDLEDESTLGKIVNHDFHELDHPSGRFINMPSYGDRYTWREFAGYIRSAVPEGMNFPYESKDGSTKVRIGSCKIRWDGFAPVLHGGNPILHPIRCLPLTIRERARIQGFPDDFVFYGTKFNDLGEWNHEKNLDMVKQTGKAMPVQFCRYVSDQVMAHIRGVDFQCSGERILKPNQDISKAKMDYCENYGYSNQEGACSKCWLYSGCHVRMSKGIGIDTKTRTVPRQEKKIVSEKVLTEKKQKDRSTLHVASLPPPEKLVIVSLSNPKKIPLSVQIGRTEMSSDVPDDYHCSCRFCSKFLGEIRPSDGSYYSRLERKKYYGKMESGEDGHIAKTPLHVARWAIQQYTKPGDWVLDPTAGAGTTLVESLIQDRNAAGVELEYQEIIQDNCRMHIGGPRRAKIGLGDARSIDQMIDGMRFKLIQNNPPYFGDQSFPGPAKEGYGKEFRHLEKVYRYDQTKPNLAHLKEGSEYWGWIDRIYRSCAQVLATGGRFVIGVKDQMRNKKPDQLHEKLARILEGIPGLLFEGVAVLKHYPGTLHLNTYFKRYGVHPPYYQSIVVFRKD